MYCKIDNSFLNLNFDYTYFNSDIKVAHYYSNERKGGSTFYMMKDLKKFWSLHYKDIFTIKPNVRYAIFTSQNLVTPHTDGGNDSVALNFYLNTNADATIFYEKKHDDVKPYPKTKSYDVTQLNEIGRFVAYNCSTYLMDVQTIHGIDKKTNEDRVLISYRWKNYSFNQILNSLKL